MIRVYFQPPGAIRAEPSEPGRLPDLIGRDGWVWVDVRDEDTEELTAIGELLGLDPLAVEDATIDTHFPKVDDYGTHVFVVLHGLSERDGRLETGELDAFVGEPYLVTVHRGESPAIEWAVSGDVPFAPTPDLMLARIAETSARRFLPLLDAIDDEIDALEERAVAGDGTVVPEIQALRRDAVRVRRTIGPQREVLAALSRAFSPVVGERAQAQFASVYDHHLRVVESLDGARALLAATLDTYRGAVAERMNEVMKVLAVYAAILLPLSVLAGIYGMNFVNMPELQWRFGYFLLLGIMAAVTLGQWVYFARRGFIGAFKFARVPRAVGRGLVRLAQLPVDAAVTIARLPETLPFPGDGARDEEPPQSGDD